MTWREVARYLLRQALIVVGMVVVLSQCVLVIAYLGVGGHITHDQAQHLVWLVGIVNAIVLLRLTA